MEHYDLDLFNNFVGLLNLKYILNTIWLRMYWVHLGVPDMTLIS